MDHEKIESEAAKHGVNDDFRRAEPIFEFAAVKHELQRADAEAQHRKPNEVEMTLQIQSGVLQENPLAGNGDNAEQQVNVERPAPVIKISQIAAQCRPEDWPQHNAHDPERHSLAALRRRKDVEHD